MPLAENKNVIQTVAPKRSDQSLNIGILPRRARGDGSVTYAHPPNSPPEHLPISTVIVAHQIGRSRIPGKCRHDLLGQPLRRRMAGHREPQQFPPPMADNKECKQLLKSRRRNHAEIDRRNGVRMAAQKCLPALRRWLLTSQHVLGDSRLSDREAELEQFAMDPRGSP